MHQLQFQYFISITFLVIYVARIFRIEKAITILNNLKEKALKKGADRVAIIEPITKFIKSIRMYRVVFIAVTVALVICDIFAYSNADLLQLLVLAITTPSTFFLLIFSVTFKKRFKAFANDHVETETRFKFK